VRGRVSAAVVGAVLAGLVLPGAALANEQIWALLKSGGQVLLMRHAVTTPGRG
jgi:hypothetical protein